MGYPVKRGAWEKNSPKIGRGKSIIDLFHNGDQIKYSFVLMLISLTNLTAMSKIQKNI